METRRRHAAARALLLALGAAVAVAAATGCGGDTTSSRTLGRGGWESRLRASFCDRPMPVDFPHLRPPPPPGWELYEATGGQFGLGCPTHDGRLRSAHDAALMDAYAALLDGTRDAREPLDSATLLWWLAEGGRARDADEFVRRVAAGEYPNYEDQSFAAWYGVARHAATNPAAAAQLARLPDKIGPFQRGRLTMMLALVNDTAARDALRRLRATEGFPAHLAAIADSALAWPALPPFAGRWPCSADERAGRTASGAFGCVADTAATLVIGSPVGPREIARLTTGGDAVLFTADGASAFADGEAAVTVAVMGSRTDSALVHLPLSVAAPWLGTVEGLARMNGLPWMLLREMDDWAATVLAGGVSDAAANRIVFRKLTPWSRPWELSIVDDRGARDRVSVRLTRAQLDQFARALRRAVEAARDDARRGPWRKVGSREQGAGAG